MLKELLELIDDDLEGYMMDLQDPNCETEYFDLDRKEGQ